MSFIGQRTQNGELETVNQILSKMRTPTMVKKEKRADSARVAVLHDGGSDPLTYASPISIGCFIFDFTAESVDAFFPTPVLLFNLALLFRT